ncbi:MAG TPA: homoserine O-succinyltransferase [Candidatus Borkfalkia excrementavium]|uniref:Homoserine O-acetyltransferase n=1 Tax=Candidatus Borkfalkia excrementavium TaxID=2838505 RepID=A0A9D2CG12_9FIRM|nr:homoserine O-succinyltransferase [Candidatus Borkfalkia excrementavium]
MPIVISKDIPAFSALKEENIFVMNDERAFTQDIRPLEIAILNLMPTKVETETQFMRLLSNSPLQVNITLLYTETYKSKNTAAAHLEKFYKKFDDIKDKHFDGMIITGAPVETMPFEEVKYWDELKKIFDFADKQVTSTIYICWGAQAALYYYYGVDKKLLPEKLFGVFPHKKYIEQHDPLLKGIDDVFYVPHSRHTTVDMEDVKKIDDLIILSESEYTGLSIAKSRDNKKIFLTGHMEYDRFTLKTEYERDLAKGLKIKPPFNYFTDDTHTDVKVTWTSAANLFYTNWLNYYVYQVTPFKF